MDEAVSYWPLTMETQVPACVSPRKSCGGQSGTGTRIPPSSLVFPCQYYSTVALQTSCWG
jgi:hypothetical protein